MKIFVTTGCGNIIQGGADMWTNNFIELVFPYLTNSFILVDGRKPNGWKDTYGLEKSNKLHFHFDNPQKTEQILEKCDEIHFIHANYHKGNIFGSGKKNGELYLYKHIYPIC